MPCNGMEGIDWGSVEARDAKDQIKVLRKVIDDQADSLCILRQLVLVLMKEHMSLTRDTSVQALLVRLHMREERHAEFDRMGARP